MTRRTAEQLGAGALAAYLAAGWRLTEHGRLDTGVVTGPCARCREMTVLYGERGQPLCPVCREERK